MPSISATGEEGLNMVLLIQVPLKQKPRRYAVKNVKAEDQGNLSISPFTGGGMGGGGMF